MNFSIDTTKRFYIHWTDIPENYQLGMLSCNTLEMARQLAKIKVLYSGLNGKALITDTSIPRGECKQIERLAWDGLTIVVFKREQYKWKRSHVL